MKDADNYKQVSEKFFQMIDPSLLLSRLPSIIFVPILQNVQCAESRSFFLAYALRLL